MRGFDPGVQTPGYSQDVPSGQERVAYTGSFRPPFKIEASLRQSKDFDKGYDKDCDKVYDEVDGKVCDKDYDAG